MIKFTESPLESIHDTIVFDSLDYSTDRRMAWIYGIAVGWDDAIDEICNKFRWNLEDKARLIRLHKRYVKLSKVKK